MSPFLVYDTGSGRAKRNKKDVAGKTLIQSWKKERNHWKKKENWAEITWTKLIDCWVSLRNLYLWGIGSCRSSCRVTWICREQKWLHLKKRRESENIEKSTSSTSCHKWRPGLSISYLWIIEIVPSLPPSHHPTITKVHNAVLRTMHTRNDLWLFCLNLNATPKIL